MYNNFCLFSTKKYFEYSYNIKNILLRFDNGFYYDSIYVISNDTYVSHKIIIYYHQLEEFNFYTIRVFK